MKHLPSIFVVLGLTSGVMLLPLAAQAQSASPAPSATPSVSAPAAGSTSDATAVQGKGGERREAMKARMAALTPAEREQLKAARQKAMQDPAVKAAEGEKRSDPKAFHKTVHEAMLRADPTIGPVLEKLRPAGDHQAAGAAE